MMVLAENMNDDIVLGERNVDKLNMLCGTQKTISSMFGWNYPGENIIENKKIKNKYTVNPAKTGPRKAVFNKQRVTK